MTWEERMAARTRERNQPDHVGEWDLVAWRKANVVLAKDHTTILYPHGLPCRTCGLELDPDFTPKDHPFIPGPEEGVCRCGWHQSYHRAHDCYADNDYEPMACACSGGQPWSCCVNYHARQQQFLLQRLANVLRAAIQP